MGISTVEWFRFNRRTSHMPNLMHKLLKFIFTSKHFRPLYIVKVNWVQLIKFDVWINRRTWTQIGIKFGTWKDQRLNWALAALVELKKMAEMLTRFSNKK